MTRLTKGFKTLSLRYIPALVQSVVLPFQGVMEGVLFDDTMILSPHPCVAVRRAATASRQAATPSAICHLPSNGSAVPGSRTSAPKETALLPRRGGGASFQYFWTVSRTPGVACDHKCSPSDGYFIGNIHCNTFMDEYVQDLSTCLATLPFAEYPRVILNLLPATATATCEPPQ